MAKTISCGIEAVISGNSNPTAQEPIQLTDEANPEARPRIAKGNISPTSTQVQGAQVKE